MVLTIVKYFPTIVIYNPCSISYTLGSPDQVQGEKEVKNNGRYSIKPNLYCVPFLCFIWACNLWTAHGEDTTREVGTMIHNFYYKNN